VSIEPVDAMLRLRDVTVACGGRAVVRDSSILGTAEVL
jgi:hypothetical protein